MSTIAFGIPELDSRVGPIVLGSLILVEADEEAYPTLFLHFLLYNIAVKGEKIAYIIVGDSALDYEEAVQRAGLNIKGLKGSGIWKYFEEEVGDRALKLAFKMLKEGYHVVLDMENPPEISKDDVKLVRESRKLLILRVNPHVSDVKALKKIERLAHMLMKLHVEKQARRTIRTLEISKFKLTPRSDIEMRYTVSEAGISIEAVTRII